MYSENSSSSSNNTSKFIDAITVKSNRFTSIPAENPSIRLAPNEIVNICICKQQIRFFTIA